MPLSDLVVIVGPNNSGKSRCLKDILSIICAYDEVPKLITAAPIAEPERTTELTSIYGFDANPNDATVRFSYLKPEMNEGEGFNSGQPTNQWPNFLVRYGMNQKFFGQCFGRQLTVFLRTDTRLSLTSTCGSATNEKSVGNLLQALYAQSPAVENAIRAEIRSAFGGLDLRLDFATSPSHLQFRVGRDFSGLPADPREARPILLAAEKLDNQGDGLRSYVTIITALTTLKRRPVVLVDEPEAFLHPPQAYRIGEHLAKQASERQIIVATHSADVLRGIVFNNPNAQVIRIERDGSGTAVRVMDQQQLREVALSPLLSAAGVLNGLFYSAVVVTEAAADSRFYQALVRRLRPDADVYFVNADNKQTVPRILARYRQMGVACAGIVDIDVLNDKKEFKAQLDQADISETKANELESLRAAIQNEVVSGPKDHQLKEAATVLANALAAVQAASGASSDEKIKALAQLKTVGGRLKAEASAWKEVKAKGGQALNGTRNSFSQLLSEMAGIGLFIAPFGELEAALVEFGIPYKTDRRSWIEAALQLVPNLEPDNSKQPWAFVRSLLDHLHVPI